MHQYTEIITVLEFCPFWWNCTNLMTVVYQITILVQYILLGSVVLGIVYGIYYYTIQYMMSFWIFRLPVGQKKKKETPWYYTIEILAHLSCKSDK